MSSFVLDASIALAWCFEDEVTAAAEATLELLRESAALVPAIWPFEVANALLAGERRGRVTESHGTQLLEVLSGLPIEVEPPPGRERLGRLTALARRHGLSVYDGAYLDLAARRNLPLATADKALISAASTDGVRLLTR
ncbi:MAG: type II toxin-antitoxin system VapC family toxin [Candidatus Dormibacteria bacterium]